MKKQRSGYPRYLVALWAFLAVFSQSAKSQTWTQPSAAKNSAQLQWAAVKQETKIETKVQQKPAAPPKWKRVELDQIILTGVESTKSDKAKVATYTYPASGTTFSNDKAIWRDETWHPQISGTVPIGFGPQWPNDQWLNLGNRLTNPLPGHNRCWLLQKHSNLDTTIGICNEYIDQIERIGDGQYNLSDTWHPQISGTVPIHE